jgi:hypothetical protein
MRTLRAEQKELWRTVWQMADRIEKAPGHRKSANGTLKRVISILEKNFPIAADRRKTASPGLGSDSG